MNYNTYIYSVINHDRKYLIYHVGENETTEKNRFYFSLRMRIRCIVGVTRILGHSVTDCGLDINRLDRSGNFFDFYTDICIYTCTYIIWLIAQSSRTCTRNM